ncbi:MAG: class I SAM-dependent methyltransferase [Ignavibacteriales bacterium]|nr:class I SAM-dependent methyltransferase [Ignavibacteriales bacterium]
MKQSGKTHLDYLSIIGGTAATYRNYGEKRWNQYYFNTYKMIVRCMLKNVPRDEVLDVGTSHGNWHRFLRTAGFKEVIGVELDEKRAEEARQTGYDIVYNCDAANVPRESSSFSAAVSNDVFVHILQLSDKIAVLKEVERLLRPGGVFILNHSMSTSIMKEDYQVVNHCSFLSLNDLIRMISENTSFKFIDIKPSYYHFRKMSENFFVKYLRSALIYVPFSVSIFIWLDSIISRSHAIGESDYVYVKLQKPL